MMAERNRKLEDELTKERDALLGHIVNKSSALFTIYEVDRITRQFHGADGFMFVIENAEDEQRAHAIITELKGMSKR